MPGARNRAKRCPFLTQFWPKTPGQPGGGGMSGETTEMSKYQLDACVVDDQPAVLAHQADDFLIVDIEGCRLSMASSKSGCIRQENPK